MSLVSACVHKDIEYIEGEKWQSQVDPCEQCHCQDGAVSCSVKEQCEDACTHGVKLPSTCCSPCEG